MTKKFKMLFIDDGDVEIISSSDSLQVIYESEMEKIWDNLSCYDFLLISDFSFKLLPVHSLDAVRERAPLLSVILITSEKIKPNKTDVFSLGVDDIFTFDEIQSSQFDSLLRKVFEQKKEEALMQAFFGGVVNSENNGVSPFLNIHINYVIDFINQKTIDFQQKGQMFVLGFLQTEFHDLTVMKKVERRLFEFQNKNVIIIPYLEGKYYLIFVNECNLANIFATAIIMQKRLSQSLSVDLEEKRINVQIGLSMYPNDSRDIEKLIVLSEKASCRNVISFFDEKANQKVNEIFSMQKDLRLSLSQDAFVVYAEPVVNFLTKTLYGLNIEIKYKHREKGLLSAPDYYQIADQMGLLTSLISWQLREVKRILASFDWPFLEYPKINLLFPNHYFKMPDMQARLQLDFPRSDVLSEKIIINLDAKAVLNDKDKMLSRLGLLQEFNFSLALSDVSNQDGMLFFEDYFPFESVFFTLSNKKVNDMNLDFYFKFGASVVLRDIQKIDDFENIPKCENLFVCGHLVGASVPLTEISDWKNKKWNI